jgi:hypothetical protein
MIKFENKQTNTFLKPFPMCYELKTLNGCSEAVIDDNCGISKFYAIANTLSKDLKVNFLNQVDDAETLDWDFQYRGQFLTLHVVMEVAHFLEHRVY